MYATMIALSILLGLSTYAFSLMKKSIPGNIVLYSVFLELLISIYLALMMTYILSKGTVYGLNGSGGAAGMLIGTAIIYKIIPQYGKQFFSSCILSLPLMYGIGKIGCAFAGCCGGIGYNGPFHIHSACGNVFPIQAVEAAVFLIIFVISLWFYRNDRFHPLHAAIIYCIMKIFLDFFRETHESQFITANQIMCFGIALFLEIIFQIKKRRITPNEFRNTL